MTRMFARGYFRRTSADELMEQQFLVKDVLSFEKESHTFIPGRRGDPLCYRGVVEGGEYAFEYWVLEGGKYVLQEGTGKADVAFRIEVSILNCHWDLYRFYLLKSSNLKAEVTLVVTSLNEIFWAPQI